MTGRLRVLFAGLLAMHGVLLAFTAARTAPTLDEPAHLAAGIYHWRTARFDLYTVNPPFVKLVASLPATIAGVKEDWSELHTSAFRAEWAVGRAFIDANGPRILWLVTLARWACIPFSILGAYICYLWSTHLFGRPAGWIAAMLWCFSPTILGNGALISADVPAAAVGILAGYLFSRWMEQPSWNKATASGAALGLCWLVKLTWVILPAIWLLVFLLTRPQAEGARGRFIRRVGQLAYSFGLGLLVLNAGYAFEGTFTPLGDFQFESDALGGPVIAAEGPSSGNRFEGTILGSVPLPLPSAFVSGFDSQKQDFEESRPLYFLGERSLDGWWYFYIVALMLKEPPALFILCLFSFARLAASPEWRRTLAHLAAVWVPAVSVFVLVSCHPQLNYYRYLIPALPYGYIVVSQAATELEKASVGRKATVLLVVALYVLSGISSVPHSLSYVNVFGGGRARGYKAFSDCNFDWGQDLLELRRWVEEHPQARPIHMGYFGAANPQLAGIEVSDMPLRLIYPELRRAGFKIPPGWYAISVSHLHGIRGVVHQSDGRVRWVRGGGLTIFESATPVDRAAPSIFIYYIRKRE